MEEPESYVVESFNNLLFVTGKSIEELTDYCKRLSNAEELGELSSLSEDSDHDGEGKERAFHHPFEVKDRGPIVMNIRVRNIKYIQHLNILTLICFRTPFQSHQNQQVH